MNTIIQKVYNNSEIEFEVIGEQVFANATAMCQVFGKRPVDWLRLPQTQRYIEAVKVKCENLTSLIETRKGNSSEFNQGTWIHEKLILKLAQWLDVDFEIWCDEQIAELLKNGKVELQKKELSRKELALMILQAEEEKEKLLLENNELKPKAQFYDAVVQSQDVCDMNTVAKVLNLPIGRNKLFEFLRKKKILMENNVPYQKWINDGWFRLVESKFQKPDGTVHVNFKTVVYQKGIDGINRVFNNVSMS